MPSGPRRRRYGEIDPEAVIGTQILLCCTTLLDLVACSPRTEARPMRRREFITLIGGAAAAWPLVGRAQQPVTPLVGVLCARTAQALERYFASFREGMRGLGYVEGSNVRFEFRFADGYLDRLPDLAIELARLNPRVIVSTPLPAHLAARKATSTIPIVMATGADPVGFGLVASLS